jgi:hypothetical protein
MTITTEQMEGAIGTVCAVLCVYYARRGPVTPGATPAIGRGVSYVIDYFRKNWLVVGFGALAFGLLVSSWVMYEWPRATADVKYVSRDIDYKAIMDKWLTYRYQEIYNQTFQNETVKLDGKKFLNCTFDNVTFQYEGTAPFLLAGGQVRVDSGSLYSLKSNNPIVKETMHIFFMAPTKTNPTTYRYIPPDNG